MKLHKCQAEILTDNSRFLVVIAGRRFGKTEVASWKLCLKSVDKPNQRIAYIAPTYNMAKRIMWARLKRNFPPEWIRNKNETSPQTIELKNGSVITLHGAQNYDTLRGEGYDYVVMDECADIAEEAWTEVIRPALSDKQGSAFLIGTPKGINNWTYDLTKSTEWKYLSYTTLDGGIVPAEEVESARRHLDERTFRQEYLATFESATGIVYYSFSEANYTDTVYQPHRSTIVSFDFNPDPFCATISQDMGDVDGKKIYHTVKEFKLRNSNAEDGGNYILRWLEDHNQNGRLRLTGDYTGINRSGYASFTGWEILSNIFKNMPGYDGHHIRRTRSLQDSINAVNSLFCTGTGVRRMFVNPETCPQLIADLQRVQYRDDGKLDDQGGKLTHLSDTIRHLAYQFEPLGETVEANI